MAKTPEELEAEKTSSPDTLDLETSQPQAAAASDNVASADVFSPNEQQQFDALKDKRQGEFKRQQYAADMDAEDAALKERRDQQFRQKKVASGDYPSYMAEEGDMIPSPDGGDSFVRKGPEISQSPNPNQMPEQGNLFGIQGLDKDSQREYRREQKRLEKERVNALMTERARERRGLPPLNEEARQAALDPDVARLYRQEGVTSRPVSGASQGPVSGPAGQASGGAGQYQTGQEVTFDKPIRGRTSTKVYSVGDGIALPSSDGLDDEEYLDAFKQINPNKSPIGALRGISRGSGPEANAAKRLLKNVGASENQPLTPSQRKQLEDQLGKEAIRLISAYSRRVADGTESAATAISTKEKKDEADLIKRREEIRKRADDLRKENENMTMADALAQAEQRLSAEELYDKTGKTEGLVQTEDVQPMPEPVDVDTSTHMIGDKLIPADAMQEGITRKDGRLFFAAEGMTKELPAVLVSTATGKQVAAPVARDEEDVKNFPPGTSYVLDGRLYSRGQPGRPTDKEETPYGQALDKPDFDVSGTRARITAERREEQKALLEEPLKVLGQANESYSDATAELAKAIGSGETDEISPELAQKVKSGSYTPGENTDEDYLLERNYPNEYAILKEQFDSKTAAQEKYDLIEEQGVELDVSQEDLRARIKQEQSALDADTAIERQLQRERGDDDELARYMEEVLPRAGVTNISIGPKGKVAEIGGTQVPFHEDDYGHRIYNPSTVEEAIALESESNGYIPVGSASQTLSEAYMGSEEARDLYRDLESMYPITEENSQQVAGILDQLVQAKYGNSISDLNEENKRKLYNAIIPATERN